MSQLVVFIASADTDLQDLSDLWTYYAEEPDTQLSLDLMGTSDSVRIGPFQLPHSAAESDIPNTLVATVDDPTLISRVLAAHEQGARIIAVGEAALKVQPLNLVGSLCAESGDYACRVMEANKPPPPDPATLLMNEIRANPQADWCLDTMAKHTGTSVRTLNRRFDHLIKTSPGDFVTSVRLEVSQQILTEEDCTIPEVAKRSGFGSADTLRHHYNKRFGCSPAAYRKNSATSDGPEAPRSHTL